MTDATIHAEHWESLADAEGDVVTAADLIERVTAAAERHPEVPICSASFFHVNGSCCPLALVLLDELPHLRAPDGAWNWPAIDAEVRDLGGVLTLLPPRLGIPRDALWRFIDGFDLNPHANPGEPFVAAGIAVRRQLIAQA